MRLSVVIVNYKAADYIDKALASFLPAYKGAIEIIVVNNGDDGDKVTGLLQKYSACKLIEMGYNAGFARSNNVGIKAATGDILLLLNPDIIDFSGAIEKCFERFKNDTFIAASVQLLNEDGSPQITGNYFITGGLNLLLPLPVTGTILKFLGQLSGVKKTNLPDSSSLEKVDWINGAFMMLRKAILKETGLLDEEFFLYAEEIEWCARLKKAGEICVYGDLKLIHLQGESANKSFGSAGKGYYNLYDRKGLQLMVSNFLRIRKQFGAGWLLLHAFFYGLEMPLLFIRVILQLFPASALFPSQNGWVIAATISGC